MIKRFNYTGRTRVPHSAIRIVVHGKQPTSFDATWDLTGIVLDSRLRVYVEASSVGSPSVRRFDCGTIGEPVMPRDVPLGDLGGDSPTFQFKVVDEREEIGLIHAWAERLQPERPDLDDDEASRAPLLPVNFADLGEVPWRLTFDTAGDQPHLLVNRRLPHAREFIRGKVFGPLVFPQVVEQILRRVVELPHVEVTNDDDDWRDLWLRLALLRNGNVLPPQIASAKDLSEDELCEIDQWILEAVDAFAAKQGWRELLQEAMEEGDA